MKRRAMKYIAGVLAFILMVTIVPVQAVYAAPKKLTLKDFNYSYDGDSFQYSFLDTGGLSFIVDKKAKTYRGVRVGSKLSVVKKKYGNADKKKFDTKDSFNKYIKEYDFVYGIVISNWKNYVEYAHKKNTKNDRRLRFYLDKNDKVAAIVYIYKYKNYKLSSKTVKSIGFSFQPSKGKKITMKTINGKRVSVLPANTKIVYNQSKVSEFGILAYINMYDTKNRRCGEVIMPINLNWSGINGSEVKKLLKEEGFSKYNPSTGGSIKTNLNKLGKYNYFEFVIYDLDYKGGFDRPLRYYFRLK